MEFRFGTDMLCWLVKSTMLSLTRLILYKTSFKLDKAFYELYQKLFFESAPIGGKKRHGIFFQAKADDLLNAIYLWEIGTVTK